MRTGEWGRLGWDAVASGFVQETAARAAAGRVRVSVPLLLGQLQIVCERERALLLLTAAAGTQTLGFVSCTCSLKPVHVTAMGLWESIPLQSL